MLQVHKYEIFTPDEKTIHKNISKIKTETIDKINEALVKTTIKKQ